MVRERYLLHAVHLSFACEKKKSIYILLITRLRVQTLKVLIIIIPKMVWE